MKRRPAVLVATLVLACPALWLACTTTTEGSAVIQPGPEAQKQLLTAMIQAESGDVIELGEGRFELDTTLSLDVDGVTIRGAGIGKTVLDFSNQAPGSGGEGVLVTGDDFTIEQLSVESSRGDAIKVEGTKGATFRHVRVDWPGPVKTENGAYGLYPVQVEDVLIEHCEVRGASDAGIYVGQSKNIIVRHNKAWENVAGIEIENSQDADVYGNEAWGNSGGLLVFSLPELPVKDGRRARLWDNHIHDNNHENFGKPGAIVSSLPPGTGLMVMANDEVEVFENKIADNNSANLSIVSFLVTQREFDDEGYDPYPEGVWVHDNEFTGGGSAPAGTFAEAVKPILGDQFPDIIYDGIVDESKMVDGSMPADHGIYLSNNGDADFANVDLGTLFAGGTPTVVTDIAAYEGRLSNPPSPVEIEGVEGAPESAPAPEAGEMAESTETE